MNFYIKMFSIRDFINIREFIAKLNDKMPVLFDGKYTSLTDIPDDFPPAEHTHSLASAQNDGCLLSDDLKEFFVAKERARDRKKSHSNDFKKIGNNLQLSTNIVNWETQEPLKTKVSAADFMYLLNSKYQYVFTSVAAEVYETITIPVYPYCHNIINLSASDPLGISSKRQSANIRLLIDFTTEQIRSNLFKKFSSGRCIGTSWSSRFSLTPLFIPITFTFDIRCNGRYTLTLDPVLSISNNVKSSTDFILQFFTRCDYIINNSSIEELYIPPVYVSKKHVLGDGGYVINQPYTEEAPPNSILLEANSNFCYFPEAHYPNNIISCRRITISGALVIRKNIGENEDITRIIPTAEFIVYNVS